MTLDDKRTTFGISLASLAVLIGLMIFFALPESNPVPRSPEYPATNKHRAESAPSTKSPLSPTPPPRRASPPKADPLPPLPKNVNKVDDLFDNRSLLPPR